MPKWQFEPYVFPVIHSFYDALGTADGCKYGPLSIRNKGLA